MLGRKNADFFAIQNLVFGRVSRFSNTRPTSIYCKKCMKIDGFGEQFITRESICGNFCPSGLAWGGIWDRFLRKMLKACFSPKNANHKIDFRGKQKSTDLPDGADRSVSSSRYERSDFGRARNFLGPQNEETVQKRL